MTLLTNFRVLDTAVYKFVLSLINDALFSLSLHRRFTYGYSHLSDASRLCNTSTGFHATDSVFIWAWHV